MDKNIAIERILETENLTDALTDADANWLLDWGTARVGGLVEGIADDEQAGAKVNQLMAVMRSLNQIAGDHSNRDSQQLAREIRTLGDRYATAFGEAPVLDEAQIARISAALPTMAPQAAMQFLLARLERSGAAPATSPGSEPSAVPASSHVPMEERTPQPPPPPNTPTPAPSHHGAQHHDARGRPLPRRIVSFIRSPRGRKTLPIVVLGVVLGIVAVIALIVGLLSRSTPARYVAAPSSDITAYFTDPSSQYSGGIDDYVVADLDKARTSIDIASFDFNLPSVVNAVTRAKQRGVAVRVVLDETNGSQVIKAGDMPDKQQFDALAALNGARIPVSNGGRSNGLMHDKFILIDHTILFVGSWNMSFNDTFRNNNNLLRITNPTLIANYQAKFDELFIDKRFGTSARVGARTPQVTVDGFATENYFSPPDRVMSKLIALVRGAKHSVHFLAFTYTDAGLADAMIARAKAGVQVRGVIENRGASQGALPKLYCNKIPVEVDGNPYTMHHKVMILDGQTVVTGSFNFTQSADKYNDDNVLVLRDPALAALYEQEFNRVAAAGKQPSNVTCPAA